MKDGLTSSLARFVSKLAHEAVPPNARQIACMAIQDYAAVLIGGSDEPVTRLAIRLLDPCSSANARVAFSGLRASVRDAAWVNAIAAHSMEFDDVGLMGHPSAVLAAAILAEAEALDCSGREAITAYVGGFEVWAALLDREPDAYHTKGWHTTSVIGSVAAAAAVACLRRLDADQVVVALGLAASMASGTRANFGTMGKPLQAGMAAQSAVLAVHLAAAGASSAANALEHPAGLLAALSPKGRVDLESEADNLGYDWQITRRGVHLRKYPMCYGAERAIDGMLDLVTTADLQADAVRRITILTGENQIRMLRYSQPSNALEARFSMEFAIACALLRRSVSLMDCRDDFVQSADLQSAMRKIVVHGHGDVDREDPRFGAFDQIVVEMIDGGRIESPRIRYARGHHRSPLSAVEMWKKFEQCSAKANREARARVFFDQMQNLDTQPSVLKVGL